MHRFSQTPQSLEKCIFHDQQAETLVACQDSQPLGLVMFSMTHRNFTLFQKPGMYLHDLYVLPAFRRQGVARKLIDYLKALAKERQFGRINFVVLKDNTPALHLYQSFPDIKEVDYVQTMRINLEN